VLIIIIIIIYVNITKIINNLKFEKFSHHYNVKFCYLSYNVGGVYHPEFAVVFIYFGAIHI
jgi:hypothetical protein